MPLPPDFDTEALETFELPDEAKASAEELAYREDVRLGVVGYDPKGYARAQAMMERSEHLPSFCSFKPGLAANVPRMPPRPSRPFGGSQRDDPRWAQPSPPSIGWAQQR